MVVRFYGADGRSGTKFFIMVLKFFGADRRTGTKLI